MTLRIQGIHFAYGAEPTLNDVNLHVEAGESVFLLGPSGCGKSTLLRCITGLETPTAGRVHLDGQDVTGAPTHARRIGLMFQEPALFPHLNVAQNIAFGIRYRTDAPDADEVVDEHLEMVGLAGRSTARVDELSGGQRQRVALARTLAAAPRAVLLDEPLSALDRDLREDLGTRIKDGLKAAGVPALWVTHDEREAARLADRTLEMRHGSVFAKS